MYKNVVWQCIHPRFMKERNHINVTFVVPALDKKGTWSSIQSLFMKERNHTDAIFVVSALEKKGDLNRHTFSVHEEKKPFNCEICRAAFYDKFSYILHQFMKERSHLNARFVINNFPSMVIYQNILHQCMEGRSKITKIWNLSIKLYTNVY